MIMLMITTMMPSIPTLYALFILPRALLAAVEPRQATWSDQAYGPDGPWNAVEVSIGSQPNIALFPGGMWQTFVTTSDYCAFNASVPHCASGTYRKNKEDSEAGTTLRIGFKPPGQDLSAGVEVLASANMYLDSIDMLARFVGPIQNHTFALIESESQMFRYPDGTRYPIFTGCLSLGSPEPKQVFGDANGKPTVNASMIPWTLKTDGVTPSSSFGMHYGAAEPSTRTAGSLIFGGYDRNRVMGNVLSLPGILQTGSGTLGPVSLRDISITVIKGSSPFVSSDSSSTSTIPGLLAQGNSSITSAGLPVILDPCSPYLTLPKSTCDAIASHLPVTFNASLGLYTWDTTSPRYTPIASSASALSFTFMGGSNTQSLTIHVPFRHLNLTLTPPLTDRPTPYLPCFVADGGVGGVGGAYVLGRAFFQDAFLGANWERGTVWLAQAPGPNIPAGVNLVAVQPGDETIAGGANDWETSWDGFWKALSDEEAQGTEPVTGGGDGGSGSSAQDGASSESSSSSSSSADKSGDGNGGLSVGTIAGIAVGSAVGVMAVIGVAVFFWWRRRRMSTAAAVLQREQQEQQEQKGILPATVPAADDYPIKDDYVKGPAWRGFPFEAPNQERRVYEMPLADTVYEMPGHIPSQQYN